MVAVDGRDLVDLGGKVKFPRGVVLLAADRKAATDLMLRIRSPQAAGPVMGATTAVGDYGTATAGYGGTATAGDFVTATAGDNGTATVRDVGTATAGYGGTATAGYHGIIRIRHWDGNRYRDVVGYIGEDGLQPNTPYRLDAEGRFAPA